MRSNHVVPISVQSSTARKASSVPCRAYQASADPCTVELVSRCAKLTTQRQEASWWGALEAKKVDLDLTRKSTCLLTSPDGMFPAAGSAIGVDQRHTIKHLALVLLFAVFDSVMCICNYVVYKDSYYTMIMNSQT